MISNFFEIFLLSIVQGISEFLPISSAAHLILVSNIYEFKNQSLLIDISLHLGSLLAILFYFRKDIFDFKLKEFQEKAFNTNSSILIEIPTGEGKTEASLLWAINNLQNRYSKII